MTTPVVPAVLDLDARRAERAKARSARREGRTDTLPVRLGGETVASLPPEFPINVLHPLTEVGPELGYVIRAFTQAANTADRDQQAAGMRLLTDVLGAYPSLPVDLIQAVKSIGRQLLGEAGYEALVAYNPSREDLTTLAAGILAWYGVSLGELLPSSPSSQASGGETSNPTSSAATASTRGASGKSRAKRASSARAVS